MDRANTIKFQSHIHSLEELIEMEDHEAYQLFAIHSDVVSSIFSLESLIQLLPGPIRKTTRTYHRDQPAYNHVLGRLLLVNAMKYNGHPIDELAYNEFGKPFLMSAHFNITHSHDLVYLVFSDHYEVGIDIEFFKPLTHSSFQRFLSKEEYREVLSSADRDRTLISIWTKKEAIIKALGLGLSSLTNVVYLGGNRMYLEGQCGFVYPINGHLDKERFVGHVCLIDPSNRIE